MAVYADIAGLYEHIDADEGQHRRQGRPPPSVRERQLLIVKAQRTAFFQHTLSAVPNVAEMVDSANVVTGSNCRAGNYKKPRDRSIAKFRACHHFCQRWPLRPVCVAKFCNPSNMRKNKAPKRSSSPRSPYNSISKGMWRNTHDIQP
jgi:hypothetical protein